MLDKLTHNLLELYDKLTSWEHEIVRKSGITLSQMHTLEVIGLYGNSKMKLLADKLGVTTGTLTVMVATLEKKGLIVKQPNPDDSRSIIISLTEEGEKYYREHHKYHHDLVKNVSSVLSEEQIKQANEIIEKINQQI